MTSRKLIGASGFLIALVILVSVTMISNQALKGKKLDFTEGKLYTLTDGSRNIIAGLEEPIKLRLFFSQTDVAGIPALANYGKRVRELLEEYEQASGNKIILEVIDPRPFTEEEDEAVQAGIQGLPIDRSTNLYFGLEGTNSTTGRETIPFFDMQRTQFLEYDITSLIHKLSNPTRPNLTIVSSLPISGDANDPMAAAMGQETAQPWAFYQLLSQQYETSLVAADSEEFPEDTDILMIVHPKNMNEKLTYKIDQFLARGGNALIFVDPRAEAEEVPRDPQNPMSAMFASKDSNLPEIMESLGVRLADGVIAGDRKNGMMVNVGQRNRPETVTYVAFMELTEEEMNKDEVAVAQLDRLRFAISGILEPIEESTMEFTPVFTTSEDSQRLDEQKVSAFPDVKALFQEFKPGGEKLILGGLARGTYKSAFPDGDPTFDPEIDIEKPHVAESSDPVNVLVVADVDLLSNRMWVQVQNFFGQQMMIPNADNGNMVLNFVDRLSGSDDLISIRGRTGYERPFTRVQEMTREAEEEFAATAKRLEERLAETEERINSLQAAEGEVEGQFILSDEQRKELERFREEQVQIRRELRGVQAKLNEDVEALEARLKLINIGLIPLLVGVLAVGLGLFRARRRRRY